MIAVGTRRTLDTKGTDAVMAAAEQEAMQNGYRVVIAVVDAWGYVLQLRRRAIRSRSTRRARLRSLSGRAGR
jgi:uncharacterized protein GlcG (DUF336 family)